MSPGSGAGVILDARCVGEHISGIERYVLGLIEGFKEIGVDDLRVIGRRVPLLENSLRGGSIELVECQMPPWSIRSQMFLPGLLKQLDCGVYHCPYVFAPLRPGDWRTLVTVHDMIPHVMRHELRASLKSRLFPLFDRWFRAQCRRADAIITVSDYSSRELCRIAEVPAAKVCRIYPGASVGSTDITELQIRDRFKLRGPIVSYIGRHDPYKNIGGLFESFSKVVHSVPPHTQLVIGGRPDARYPLSPDWLDQPALAERVTLTDYLEEDERIALLRASSVFVFPSKYEGFGLPPLEAMIEGVPVVSSNATSLPEVLGDAALMVDPMDSPSMGRAIATVLNDPAVAGSLRDRGRTHAATFTWRRCAEQHLALYGRVK
jgi:alpha-1,3-rhamnosyl/mannosyltransferase